MKAFAISILIFTMAFISNAQDYVGGFEFGGYSQTLHYSDFEPTIFEGSTVVENIYSPALEGNLQGNP